MNLPLLCLIFLAYVDVIYMFNNIFSGTRYVFKSGIYMTGGRSKQEMGQSQRMMFKNLKKQLDIAASQPGFFDVGEKIVSLRTLC